MKTLQFIPTVLTVLLSLGILFGYYIPVEPTIIITLLGSILSILSFISWQTNKSYKHNYKFNFVVYFLFFLIGISAVSIQNSRFQKKHYSNFKTKGKRIVLVVTKQLKSNPYYHKYETKIIQINQTSVIGEILLNTRIDSAKNKLKVGDIILLKSELKSINKPLNLYQFNYREYLKKQQIYHQITSVNSEIIHLSKSPLTLHKIAFNIREKINKSLVKYSLKKEELAIINALLLGQRQEVSKELLQSYAGAGAMHILAVSGLHIGILLLLLNILLKPIELLKKGKTIKLLLIVLLLWMYALIAGFSPSIIRAVSMFTAIAIGMLSNKKTNTLHNLFISLFFLLLINPLYLFNVGFQLSYLAVFSIVYLYPLFLQFYNPKQWFLKKVWQLLAISFSAQLGVLPISLYYFHQFPSLFFITSLVIIPLLGFILAFGVLVILLAILNILPNILADAFGLIIDKMNVFIRFISKQEAFLFEQIHYSILLLITSYLIIIFGFRYLKSPSFKKLGFALFGIVLFQTVLIYEKWQRQKTKEIIIIHKTKETILVNRKGEKAIVFSNLDSTSLAKNKALQDYKIGIGNLKYTYDTIKNIYQINTSNLLIVDSLEVYKIPKLQPEMVLLRQSPKINLERLIHKLKPKIIIADASNYKSYKKQWQKTCLKNKILFYNTSKDGAFRISD